jgi:hypothetical protein
MRYNLAMQFSKSTSLESLRHVLLGVSLGLSGGLLNAQEEPEQVAKSDSIDVASGVAIKGSDLLRATTALVRPPSADQEREQGLERPTFRDLARATGEYAQAISDSSKLSIKDLVDVRKVMEDSILLPIIVHGGLGLEAGHWLEPPLHSLYEAVLSKLEAAEPKSPSDFYEIGRERAHHYAQLIALFRVNSSGSKDILGKKLVRYYGDLDNFTIGQIFSDLSHEARNDPEFVSRFMVNNFDGILASVDKRLERFQTSENDHSDPIEYLITLPEAVRLAIKRASGFGIINEHRARDLEGRAQEALVEQVVPHLIPLWISSYRQISGYKADIFDDRAFCNPMALEQTRFRMDYLTQRVANLLAMCRDDRNKLGNVFFDQIDNLLVTRGLSDAVGYMALIHLPAMAPDPSRKEFLVDALRAGLLSDDKISIIGETIDRPTQIARVLGLCLISDHSYFATVYNDDRYDPEILIDLVQGIDTNSFGPTRYASVLTPAQMFFFELMVISRGAEHANTIDWIRPFDETSKHKLVDRAQGALKRLALDLYEFQPRGIFQSETFRADQPIGTARSWGTSPLFIPDPNREAEWKRSLVSLFRYADLVLDEHVRVFPRTSDTYHLSNHLTQSVEFLRARGSLYERGDARVLCKAAKRVRDLYSKRGGDRESLRERDIFDELSLAILEFARDQDKGIASKGSPHKFRDAPDRYVDLAQRVCIVEFVNREALNAKVSNTGALGPIRRDLMSICEPLGFLEREPDLVRLLESPDVDSLLSSLEAYRKELGSEMAELAKEFGF